jgi:hypothetical protein
MPPTNSVSAPRDLQDRIRRLVDRVGIVEAAKTLGCARETLMRAAAGISIHPGTLALVRQNLPTEPEGAKK